MNKRFFKTFFSIVPVVLSLLFIYSCEKDEERLYLTNSYYNTDTISDSTKVYSISVTADTSLFELEAEIGYLIGPTSGYAESIHLSDSSAISFGCQYIYSANDRFAIEFERKFSLSEIDTLNYSISDQQFQDYFHTGSYNFCRSFMYCNNYVVIAYQKNNVLYYTKNSVLNPDYSGFSFSVTDLVRIDDASVELSGDFDCYVYDYTTGSDSIHLQGSFSGFFMNP